jgi:glycerol kinase
VNALKLNPSVDEVAAIGITNQRETVVAWDRYTGKPFHNAIVWMDTRTQDLVAKQVADGGVNRFRHITGLPISTYFSALKLKWLISNVPSIRDGLDKNRCCFGTIDSYLTWRLTGGTVHVTDCANASRYNLMDLREQEWSEQICNELGIPMNALPTIVSNSEKVGVVSDPLLPSLTGVPITALIGDQHAALLGHGCTSNHEAKITYGTGCFLLMNTGMSPVGSKSGALVTTIGYKLGKKSEPVFALEGSVAAAGRAVQWAKENLRIGSDLQEFNEIASSVPDTCGVTFVPAFSGLFAPYWRTDARGVIVGMSLRASYRHIARAILESAAIQCAQVVDLLKRDCEIEKLPTIVTDGGMTKSSLLMQIQSDLLNAVVKRARMSEATAFGAAYCAGLHVGFWEGRSVKEISAGQSGYDEFRPAMTEDARKAAFDRWEDAVKRSFDLSKFAPAE